ncbi:peptidylprolyl isomerase [Tabrizicola sp.]|jgi:peptidyl-prolyl cis-trans isomerase SurA|uniref:peptidylprolyl isomerase n=1 Tax=Tabrizicola sp. TaxID=2005166 RepID=UPI001A53CBCA|nr:peptidylprolyl isomerase [Tabrizicola sp.]MBL9061409.1 peptidylprolyl isomerase [Tabrizicola sp.]
MRFSVLKRQAAAILISLTLGAPVLAQDLFAPRVYVNDRAITTYEVEQRALFLRVLRAPGNPEEEALKALIEDRLRQTEAERLGLKLSEKDLTAGLTEFASRANLSADEFTAELGKAGIAPETFRDFVAAGVLWRQVVRAKFLGQVPISENDIDRAMEAATRPKALQVLVSELVIPAPEGKEEAALAQAQDLSDTLSGESAFAAAARRYSASATAGAGGRLDWLPLANLPAAIGQKILALDAGEVSDPIAVPGAVVLFLLRDVAEDKTAEPISVSVEWVEFLVPDDAAEIARLRARADDCDMLQGEAKGLPEDRMTLTKAGMEAVPNDVALELAKLDPGETSVALTRGGYRRMLMLCSREPVLEPMPTRDQIREQVINQKLEGMAEGYLEELRSAAIIREP